ncbi:hypothetical protein FN846DRAFT_895521 [Sphaerosporella brunnea]|uniref:Uncharacterized protein n=1 Tax=Sphaerosporella brunnea TaxID=1250544 RepID=A0A5J5EGP4_9PEZI|nr:hypothetical protein FN846DRAFT_895521 [Sphaerosporella brunnea]
MVAKTPGAAPTALNAFEFVSRCALALLWNMAKSRVPEEVLADVEKLMDSNQTSFTMDQGLRFWGMEPPITTNGGVEKEFYEFQRADLHLASQLSASTMHEGAKGNPNPAPA